MEAWQVYPARALYAAGWAERRPPSRDAAADRLASSGACRRSAMRPARTLITELVEGAAERVLADASADADLLVLGSGSQSPVAQVDPQIVDRPTGPVIRACLSHARCPVVIISPAMAARMGSRRPGPGRRGRRSAPAPSRSLFRFPRGSPVVACAR